MTSRLRETPVSSYTPALPLPRRGHRLHDEPTITPTGNATTLLPKLAVVLI